MGTFYSKSGSSPPTEPTLVLWQDVAEAIGLDFEASSEKRRAELKDALRQAGREEVSTMSRRPNMPEVETFTRLLEAVPGLRARITVDLEGWPLVQGRYGRLEWRGEPETGQESGSPRIYAYTDRKRILFKLGAVSGVRPCQTGDDEGAVSMPATDHGAILACARLLRCHTNGRGVHSIGRSANEMAWLRASRLRAVIGRTPSQKMPTPGASIHLAELDPHSRESVRVA